MPGSGPHGELLLSHLCAPVQATVIEINAEAVDGAINAVRGALAQGLSWAELERLIRDEREGGNPVAGLIRKLSLDTEQDHCGAPRLGGGRAGGC